MGTVPNWPPPPPTTVIGTMFASSFGTVLAIATGHIEVALGAGLVTFGLATISLIAVIANYRSRGASKADGNPPAPPIERP